MKKDPPKAEKPKNAQNLKILRETLGLSQSQMALGLGGIAQGSYKMWEFETRTPAKVRAALFDAGVNLNWYDTGEGPMLRPGVSRIQIIRDEGNGKPIKLVPVPDHPARQQQPLQPGASRPLPAKAAGTTPPRETVRREAQSLVDEVVAELTTPQQRADYLELIDRVADLLEALYSQGRADQIRPTLQSLLPTSTASEKTGG